MKKKTQPELRLCCLPAACTTMMLRDTASKVAGTAGVTTEVTTRAVTRVTVTVKERVSAEEPLQGVLVVTATGAAGTIKIPRDEKVGNVNGGEASILRAPGSPTDQNVPRCSS